MTLAARFTSLMILPFALAGSSTAASAHTAARGFVLLLPTHLVITCGAVAVAVSFIVVSMAPHRGFAPGASAQPHALPRAAEFTSCLSAVIVLALVGIGFAGSTDPLENLLPLSIWTLWWVVIVVLHPLFGNLWAWINPISGAYKLLGGRANIRELPEWLGFSLATIVFAMFAWFQLVSVTPEDPRLLAVVTTIYLASTAAALAIFGAQWLGKADPFVLIFRWLGAISPFSRSGGLSRLPALPVPGIGLVLLLLAVLSFDGLAGTFSWLSAVGVNPLDFHGRSTVMVANTFGLFGWWIVLIVIYGAVVTLGCQWSRSSQNTRIIAGKLIYSLIPIAIALHFAHFLTDALVNGQYWISAVQEAIGFEPYPVTTSFLNTATGVWTIYTVQALAIVAGHVTAVVVAHRIVVDVEPEKARALRLELPMAVLMVAYTAFGLWVLSAPAVG